jgi:hypothetical protein
MTEYRRSLEGGAGRQIGRYYVNAELDGLEKRTTKRLKEVEKCGEGRDSAPRMINVLW